MHLNHLQASFSATTKARAVSVFLLLLGIVFYLLWLSEDIPALLTGNIPPSVTAANLPTNPVHVLDVGLYLPGMLITALFVPKRFGLGWTLNFGHPQSKRFIITVLVLMLVLVLLPLVVALLGGGSVHSSGCHSLGCQP